MKNNQLKDKIRGSIVGGAVGDALGYGVEFVTKYVINSMFGEKGITSYILNRDGKAVVSDDTQMTLFTANGLLCGLTSREITSDKFADLTPFVLEAYLEWYQTQKGGIDHQTPHACWIRDIKELNVMRAPGNTCLDALRDVWHAKNTSKGCGGIMRVAPVALVLTAENDRRIARGEKPLFDPFLMNRLAADCAYITHKHPMGYIAPALFVDVLRQLMELVAPPTREDIYGMVDSAFVRLKKVYRKKAEVDSLGLLESVTRRAIRLSKMNLEDEDGVTRLGEGWVAEEAWAIALYCTLKHLDSFEDAIIASVNHSGDSDSTGSICGNLMGVIVGYQGIPDRFLKDLELKDIMLALSDDMADGCPISETHPAQTKKENLWEQRYVYGRTMLKPIYNSYAVNDWLYAGEYPGDKNEEYANQKLTQFMGFGITHFIDLTEDGELCPYAHLLPPAVKHRRFPIRDVSVPDSIEEVQDLVSEIQKIHAEDPEAKVYVHCWGGVGRTGTIVGCFLASEMKQDYVEVTNVLRHLWSDCPKSERRDSPETNSQRFFIHRYIESLKL